MVLWEATMGDNLNLVIPPSLDREAILKALDAVLDPELDESILGLGFVKAVIAGQGHHIPTINSQTLFISSL